MLEGNGWACLLKPGVILAAFLFLLFLFFCWLLSGSS